MVEGLRLRRIPAESSVFWGGVWPDQIVIDDPIDDGEVFKEQIEKRSRPGVIVFPETS